MRVKRELIQDHLYSLNWIFISLLSSSLECFSCHQDYSSSDQSCIQCTWDTYQCWDQPCIWSSCTLMCSRLWRPINRFLVREVVCKICNTRQERSWVTMNFLSLSSNTCTELIFLSLICFLRNQCINCHTVFAKNIKRIFISMQL